MASSGSIVPVASNTVARLDGTLAHGLLAPSRTFCGRLLSPKAAIQSGKTAPLPGERHDRAC